MHILEKGMKHVKLLRAVQAASMALRQLLTLYWTLLLRSASRRWIYPRL